MRELEEIALSVEEFEALRLKDLEGLEQLQCAQRMGIARTTYQRILYAAREKIAEALVEGKAISIEGGKYELLLERRYRCAGCGTEFEGYHEPEMKNGRVFCSHCDHDADNNGILKEEDK